MLEGCQKKGGMRTQNILMAPELSNPEKLVSRQSVADQDLWAILKSLLPPISAGSQLVPEDV